MEKVFIGTGVVNQINYSFGIVDFSAENSFKLVDLTDTILINIQSSILNEKLGNFRNDIWENSSISFTLNDIKSYIQNENDIFSLGAVSSLNQEFQTSVNSNFNSSIHESLFNDEAWHNNFNNQFNKIDFVNLIQNSLNGQFYLNNINSLFQLWRNSYSNNKVNYNISAGFIEGQYLYFPNSIFVSSQTNLFHQKKNLNVGSIQLNKYYNLAFKIN